MSIVSWYRMLELGAIITDIDNGKIIRFKNMPITLRVEWTDGVLAGDLHPLIDFLQKHTDPILLSQWSARGDEPSELLSKYKIINGVSNSTIRRLDKVHRALQTMWSPSKADLMWRVKYGEIGNIDFDASDIHQYFEIFEKDIGSLKGKDKDKSHDTMSSVDVLSERESGFSMCVNNAFL